MQSLRKKVMTKTDSYLHGKMLLKTQRVGLKITDNDPLFNIFITGKATLPTAPLFLVTHTRGHDHKAPRSTVLMFTGGFLCYSLY